MVFYMAEDVLLLSFYLLLMAYVGMSILYISLLQPAVCDMSGAKIPWK